MSELTQENWGAKVPFDYYDLSAFAWEVTGADGDSGVFYIDNLRFVYADIPGGTPTSLNYFSADSSLQKIFNQENDSLLSAFNNYRLHVKKYLTTLETIRNYETTLKKWLQNIQASALSPKEKEKYSELIFRIANPIPGDVYMKAQEYGTKKIDHVLPLDSLYTLDRDYARQLSGMKNLNTWSSHLWNYACSGKVEIGYKRTSDTAFQKELEFYQIAPGETIAEIGAGTGFFEQAISKFCDSLLVYVNEIDSANVEKLRLKLALLSRYDGKNISYVPLLGNDSLSGLPPNSCDAIIVKNVFHHFSSPDKMLADFKKVLKPGGRLLMADIMKGEVDRNDCAYYMERTIFMKWITEAGFELVNEDTLLYGKYSCFEFRLPVAQP